MVITADIKIKKHANVIFILFIAFVALFSFLMPLPVIAPWTIAALGFAIGLLIISFVESEEDRKFLLSVFIYSYLARILVTLALYILTLGWRSHDGFFIDDGWCYSENGWMMAKNFAKGLNINIFLIKRMTVSGTFGIYDQINAMMYLLVGKSPLSMLFMNCAIGAITVIFMYLISKLVFKKEVSRMVTMLCAFWPSLFLWSTQNLKEPATIFLVVLCFWSFISFLKKSDLMYLVIVLIGIYLLINFMPPIAVILIISIALHIAVLAYKLAKRTPLLILAICIVSVPILIKLADAVSGVINQYGSFRSSISDMLTSLNFHRLSRASANLAILPEYSFKSVGSLALYLPIGLLAVLFGPFPWQLFSLSQIFAFPEMLIWYLMVPYLIKGLRISFKNNLRYLFSMFLFIAGAIAMLSLVEGNIGTIFRHRAVALNFLLLFIVVGIDANKKKVKC